MRASELIGSKGIHYQAPNDLVWTFYGLLVVWTVVSVYFFLARGINLGGGDLGFWGMVVFVVCYTWYWSLGIFQSAHLDRDGKLRLVSHRRTLVVEADQIPVIEGPYLPVGFIRLRLEREKGYLFCRAGDPDLSQLIHTIKKINPEVKFKHIGVRN